MILMLALAGTFAASMQSNDPLLLGLAAAVGAAIGFAAYDIPRRATAAIAPGFVGGRCLTASVMINSRCNANGLIVSGQQGRSRSGHVRSG